MKSNKVKCSFTIDRNVYNAFKSIVSQQGRSVKGSIIKYMQNVIQYENPNADTVFAIQEVTALKNDPNKKVYSSFDEVLGELGDDE